MPILIYPLRGHPSPYRPPPPPAYHSPSQAYWRHNAVVAKSSRDWGRMFGKGSSKVMNAPQNIFFGMLGIKGGLNGAINKFKMPLIFVAVLLTLVGLAYVAKQLGFT